MKLQKILSLLCDASVIIGEGDSKCKWFFKKIRRNDKGAIFV